MGRNKRNKQNDSTSRDAKRRAMEDSAEVYRLRQRIANLEYTNAKTAKILMETKAKQREATPHWFLKRQLKEFSIALLALADSIPE